MKSPALAIAWEIWRKNQWAFTGVLLTFPASFLLWLLFGLREKQTVFMCEFLFVLFSVVMLFWAFSFTDVDAQGRHLGFPSRMFVLPLPTTKLVSYPMVYGTLAILLFYFSWVGLVLIQWKVRIPSEVMWCQAAELAAMMVSMQCVVWALHRFNWLRMGLLTIGGSVLAVACVLAEERGSWGGLSCRKLTVFAGFVCLLSYAGAIAAVERQRRGDWLNWLERAFQRIIHAIPRGHKPFSSPHQAQFWIEWQRRGWWLALVLGIVMAVSLALIPLSTALYLGPTLILVSFFGFPIAALWFASIAGMHLGKSDLWSPELALHPITAVRPISTGDVVIAKLKVAAVVTVLGGLVFACLTLPAMRTVHPFSHLNEEVLAFWPSLGSAHPSLVRWTSDPLVILTFIALTWHAAVRGLCPALAGSPRKNIWAVGKSLAGFGLAVLVTGWIYNHPAQFPSFLLIFGWLAAANLAWKWARTARVFTLAFRSRQVGSAGFSLSGRTSIITGAQPFPEHSILSFYSRNQLLCFLAIWMALTTGVAISAALACSARELPAQIILFLAVWGLPGHELIACGTNLSRNRHR